MLIVEDGTNVPNSNSYCTIAFADNYHALMGNLDWAGADTSIKESALIQATQSVELLYGQRYLSFPAYSVQSLLFPRYLAIVNYIQIIPANTIPVQLQRAVCEIALKQLNGEDIFPTPNTDNYIKSKAVGISGGPSKSVSYSKNPVTAEFSGFNKVEMLLKPILRPTNQITSTLSL